MNFSVLLLGGGSASGKTELAKVLSNHYKINRILADDIRISMEAVVTRDNPIYNFEEEGVTEEQRPEYTSYSKQEVSREVCKGLENIVHHHTIVEDPIIIEGDDILPDFAKARQDYSHKVRSLFIYTEDRELIKKNLLARNRFIDLTSIDEIVQDAINVNLAVKTQAEKLGLNVLCINPYETLKERVLELLD